MSEEYHSESEFYYPDEVEHEDVSDNNEVTAKMK